MTIVPTAVLRLDVLLMGNGSLAIESLWLPLPLQANASLAIDIAVTMDVLMHAISFAIPLG